MERHTANDTESNSSSNNNNNKDSKDNDDKRRSRSIIYRQTNTRRAHTHKSLVTADNAIRCR